MGSPSVAQSVGGHPTLTKAPVIEAVFEFRARASSFSLLPGALADPLKSLNYPKVVETELAKFGPMMELPDVPVDAPFLVTHRFSSEDDKSVVQIGPRGMTVNALAYPGFGAFRSTVTKVLDTYIALAQPKTVSRLGLRYINHVPSTTGRLFGSFAVKLEWPPLAGATQKSLAARMVLSYSEPPGELGIAIGDPADKASLDLDFFLLPDRPMSQEQVLAWLDRAHDRVYEAFRSMVPSELFASWK